MQLQLKALRVIGCGPFREDTTIDFCDPSGNPRAVTVLGGANGSGKTTVLQLIVALSQLLYLESEGEKISRLQEAPSPYPKASKSELPEAAYMRSAFGVGVQTPEILKHAAYAQLDWWVDNRRPFSIFYGKRPADVVLPGACWGIDYTEIPEQREARARWTIHGELALEMRRLIWEQEEQPLAFTTASTPINAPSTRLPGVIFLPYDRKLLPMRGEQLHREKIPYQWVYVYTAAEGFAGSLDSYLTWLDYAEPETFRAVCEFLNALNFEGKTFGVERQELRGIVTTRDGQTHPLSALSSGEQNILITLLELRRRLTPHSVVLIDEIENSLHPAFQHRLAQGLLTLQEQIPFQLIVTTHAPAFVEIFGAENTLLLTRF